MVSKTTVMKPLFVRDIIHLSVLSIKQTIYCCKC